MKYNPARLREIRKKRGLSLDKVSQLLFRDADISITRQALNLYEHPDGAPKADVLAGLSVVLNVPITYFFTLKIEQSALVSTAK